MSNLNKNTTQLELLLAKVKALPGGSTAAGEDVTEETNVYTAKVELLETAITALETELAGKASGGSSAASIETCTVTFNNSNLGNDCEIIEIIATILQNGVQTSYFLAGNQLQDAVINDVVCGTAITLITHLGYGMPAWAEIDGSATFDYSLEVVPSYSYWVMGFTAPAVVGESCTIYYSYEA